MLDLSFVRDNLPLVEEKLRQRGMDPGEVLKDFRAIDTERRQAITETETMKARRNRASEEIAPLKKSGQDASGSDCGDKGTSRENSRARKACHRVRRAAAAAFGWHSEPAPPVRARGEERR